MTIKEIVSSIYSKQPEIKTVYFVGCGASMSELFPGKYFLENNAKKIRASLYTANNFNYSTPAGVDDTAVVIACSLSGTTPETVAAAKLATEKGAYVVSVTIDPNSPLAANSQYQIIHGFADSYGAKMEKPANVLALACELLNTYEGYEHYEDMQDGLSKICGLINDSVKLLVPTAQKFAEDHYNAPLLYCMASGATQYVAYSFSSFLMMEMQWLPASAFHTGEFFHGPFELADENAHYLLLMNDGPTRPMDARALTFLQRMHANVTVVDAKDFGLASCVKKTVIEYFNPLLIGGVLRVYAEQMAVKRSHPLTMRRYMWKLEY